MDKQIVDVIVETPKADSNEYTWDEREQAIRFVRPCQISMSSAFEQGRIAHTLDIHGEPLPALLAITLPTFPGCRVQARPIGAVEESEDEDSRTWLVVVAKGDAALKPVSAPENLPENERQTLDHLMQAGAKWLDEDEALELLNHAQQRARLSQVGKKGSAPTLPAWKIASELGLSPGFVRESTHFTWAEYALTTLPLRFQDYARYTLLPQERILLWIYRPLLTSGGLGILGREVLRAGIAILTDQQFVWMVDPVTPGPNIEGYGYVARSFALERLERALVEFEGSQHKLVLQLRNGRGDLESFPIRFPSEAKRDVDEMAKRLNAFLTVPNERHLMRLSQPEPFNMILEDPTTTDRARTEAFVDELQSQVREAMGGETVMAQGFVPEWGEEGALLLSVTDHAVYLTPHPQSKRRDVRAVRIPLELIGTVEMCYSQLGSWFRLWLPTPRKLEKWEIGFPPTAFQSFNRCFVALRALLAKPSV